MEVVGGDGSNKVQGLSVVLRDISARHVTEQIIDGVRRNEPIDETLPVIAELVHDQVRTAGVTIAYRPEGQLFRKLAAHGVGEGLQAFTRRCGTGPDAGLPWEIAVRENRLCMQIDQDLHGRLRAAAAAHGYLGCWSAPLTAPDGRRLGALTVWTHEATEASPSERSVLLKMAEMASFALDRSDAVLAAERAARTDALTGLPDRWDFETRLEAAQTTAEAGRPIPFGVAFIDLDHFAAVNDRWGRSTGDRVLVAVAQRLRSAAGRNHVVARFGGDEFAVLCPGVSEASELGAVAQRLIDVLANPFMVDGATTQVGASVGIALDTEPARAVGELLAEADQALQRAKAGGRNRWAVA